MRVAAIAALLAWPLGLTANDTLMTLGVGGLVPTTSGAIRMESEDLTISVPQVEVKYLFRNTTRIDIDAIVAFPLPDLAGGEVTHEPLELPATDPLNFVDFKVWVSGKPVSVKMEARAFHQEQDITGRLRAAGLPVSVVDTNFDETVKRLPPGLRAQFEKEELIVKEDDWYWPNWTTRIKFYWQQRFPGGSTLSVRHTYRPVVGGSYITKNSTGAEQIKPYCGGAAALEQIARWKQHHPVANDGDIVLYERQIEYVLTTARNWLGPIGRFHLTVLAGEGPDMVLTCFPGLRRTAPKRYEFEQLRYIPSTELKLLMLEPSR